MRTLDDYIEMFGARPVRFRPGARFEYSNYGFILLGKLVEVASGETYDRYVLDHILMPAGMRHTNPLPERDRVVAIGYSQTPNGLRLTDSAFHLPPSSAGGWYSDVKDLFLFAQALRSGKLIPEPPSASDRLESDPSRVRIWILFVSAAWVWPFGCQPRLQHGITCPAG